MRRGRATRPRVTSTTPDPPGGGPDPVPVCRRALRGRLIPGRRGKFGEPYKKRPERVKEAVERVSLIGNIGKPLLTLHSTYDLLLPMHLHPNR
jgi:hypothetical protein